MQHEFKNKHTYFQLNVKFVMSIRNIQAIEKIHQNTEKIFRDLNLKLA